MIIGKKGEHICKKAGELEVCTNKLRDIQGSSYPALVIRKTMQENKQLKSMINTVDIWSNTRRRLTVKGEQYKLAQNNASVEVYTNVLLSNIPTQVPNAVQRQRVIDARTCMCGKVRYSTMRIIHIPLIWKDLTFRGVAFEELWSIKIELIV